MAKKDYFLLVDTETTVTDKVADFAAIVCDRKGNILTQCAVLIRDIFTDANQHPLFVDPNVPFDSIWSRNGQGKRYSAYQAMLESGSRMVASVSAVNRWLDRAAIVYNPILTAYNLPFDVSKCNNTGIDLNMFSSRFCLWAAAYSRWAQSRKFKNFVLSVHGFNTPTALGNMTYKTNAEIMARFLLGQPDMPDEPHTALEDIIGYELPILTAVVRGQKRDKWINPVSYNWRDCQVKNHFIAR